MFLSRMMTSKLVFFTSCASQCIEVMVWLLCGEL